MVRAACHDHAVKTQTAAGSRNRAANFEPAPAEFAWDFEPAPAEFALDFEPAPAEFDWDCCSKIAVCPLNFASFVDARV